MVRVYTADAEALKDKKLYKRLYESLDASRRAKADYFLFEKDKRLSVAAGALLAIALQKEGIWHPTMKIGANGKPYLAGEEKLYFNLSHSENRVMCAVAEMEVGCDVEKVTEVDYRLAEYVMTVSELEQIYKAEKKSEQENIFFRFWTLKESYMKATGLGISLEPGTFCIVSEMNKLKVEPPVDNRRFYFKEYFMEDGYCYSCCSLINEFCDRMMEVDLEKI